MQYDVISIGSATVDVFIKTAISDIIDPSEKRGDELLCYPLGEKILINHLEFQTGGGGTNTSVAFARLGLKTAYLGQLGEDDNADRVLAVLKREKVTFLGSKKGKTGYSVILDSKAKDRTILTYKGANDAFRFKPPKEKTTWAYCASMTGNSFKELVKAATYFKKKGAKIAFNPSMYIAKMGKTILSKLLKQCDVLILNREEAMALLGQEMDIPRAVCALRALGPGIVGITDGNRGAWAADANNAFHVNPLPVNVCETTGAGDAFASSFVAGLFYGLSLQDCMRLGMTNAESVITHYGAKNNLLTKKLAFAQLKRDAHSFSKV
ncbi:MAG: carbohydrate kinase family protein [archaeon]